MSDDIVTRLRTALDEMELGCLGCSIINQNDHDSDCLTQNAANEIERLQIDLSEAKDEYQKLWEKYNRKEAGY